MWTKGDLGDCGKRLASESMLTEERQFHKRMLITQTTNQRRKRRKFVKN